MTKKLIAEMLGILVFVQSGCSAIVFAGPAIGFSGVLLALWLAIVAATHALGVISASHLNPDVWLGFVAAGRMSFGDFLAAPLPRSSVLSRAQISSRSSLLAKRPMRILAMALVKVVMAQVTWVTICCKQP